MEQTAIDKAIDVLFYLHSQQAGCGITDISRALSLPKSSAHRLAATLTRRGLLERDDGGRYRLGIGLLSLGQGFLDQDPLLTTSRPFVSAVADDLGETCFLVAARGGYLVVIDRAEGSGLLRASPDVGARIPVRTTAAGKLYVAHAPDAVKEALSQEPSVASAEVGLASAVRRAARQGYSENVDEWIDGLSVLAAPVFTHGQLMGVLALAVPTSRFADMNRKVALTRLSSAAHLFGERLQHAHAARPTNSRPEEGS